MSTQQPKEPAVRIVRVFSPLPPAEEREVLAKIAAIVMRPRPTAEREPVKEAA